MTIDFETIDPSNIPVAPAIQEQLRLGAAARIEVKQLRDQLNAATTLVIETNDKLTEARAELAKARQDGRNAAADAIENMDHDLGNAGWKALEAQAVEAGYPVEWVRSRRRRDDFTTATIGAAYQYGYRQAAKVARGVTR